VKPLDCTGKTRALCRGRGWNGSRLVSGGSQRLRGHERDTERSCCQLLSAFRCFAPGRRTSWERCWCWCRRSSPQGARRTLKFELFSVLLNCAQLYYCPREEDKLGALLVLVREVIPAGRPTLVFASTRHHVDLLSQLLEAEGIPATYVYGTLDQVRLRVRSLGSRQK